MRKFGFEFLLQDVTIVIETKGPDEGMVDLKYGEEGMFHDRDLHLPSYGGCGSLRFKRVARERKPKMPEAGESVPLLIPPSRDGE